METAVCLFFLLFSFTFNSANKRKTSEIGLLVNVPDYFLAVRTQTSF